MLVPNSLANFALFFFNPCLCTILSIVCQKWNASARRESPSEGDYAITVFTSTSLLSLFWVLLCVKFSTSSSRSFFSLRGSKIEWVWETDKQEASSAGKCCKPGPRGAQPYQDYHKTEMLYFSCPRLRCAEPCPADSHSTGISCLLLSLLVGNQGLEQHPSPGSLSWRVNPWVGGHPLMFPSDRLYQEEADTANALADLTNLPWCWARHSSKSRLSLL